MKQNKNNILSWFDGYNKTNIDHSLRIRKNNRQKQKTPVTTLADKTIRICPKCRRAWEKDYLMSSKRIIFYPAGHIPAYGKKKVKCWQCTSIG